MRSYRGDNLPRKRTPVEEAWEALKTFFFKTVIPLTPIAVLIYFLLFTHNRDISGRYTGNNPITGTIEMNLDVKDGRVTGEMVQKGNLRFPVSSGRADDDKVDLIFMLPQVIKLSDGTTINQFTFSGRHHAAPVGGISFSTGNVKGGDYMEGTYSNGVDRIPLILRRNSASNLMDGGREGIHSLFGRQRQPRERRARTPEPSP